MELRLNRKEQLELKKKWSEQYKELEIIINDWDPMNLIRGGAPQDEYDCIGTQLLNLLHNGLKKDEVKEFIYRELDEHFDLKLEDIKLEYQQRFIDSVNKFCDDIFKWYSQYEV